MIVLDTHIWLWWVNKDAVSLSTSRQVQIESSNSVGISAISCFEVAWLDCHQRILLPCSRELWFERALQGSDIELLPITPQIASTAVNLPEHHRDPQDRLIIATALEYDAQLMSSDGKFPQYLELTDRLL